MLSPGSKERAQRVKKLAPAPGGPCEIIDWGDIMMKKNTAFPVCVGAGAVAHGLRQYDK